MRARDRLGNEREHVRIDALAADVYKRNTEHRRLRPAHVVARKYAERHDLLRQRKLRLDLQMPPIFPAVRLDLIRAAAPIDQRLRFSHLRARHQPHAQQKIPQCRLIGNHALSIQRESLERSARLFATPHLPCWASSPLRGEDLKFYGVLQRPPSLPGRGLGEGPGTELQAHQRKRPGVLV